MAFYRNTLLFAALLPASISLACAEMAVPAGFEELAKSQHLWIEVTLYGDSLGLFETDITLEKVSFRQPESLIAVIKKRFNDDPRLLSAIGAVLAAPLPRNGNLACSSNGDARGCDYLDTDSAAIIYDENNARISLFLDKHFLAKPSVDRQWYQPTRETENALVHQQNINFVADRDYQSINVQGNGALAVTQDGYFNLDWNWQGQRSRHQQTQDVTVNNAWFRQDLWRQYYVQLGEMDTRDLFSNAGGNITLSQLPVGKIRGVRAGSTRAWLNPVQQSQGTPVTVFLSHDARIDARRGNQLLGSFYLNAGAQALDTRAFPDGSYTVSLAIYENNRLLRTEEVPFTRTGVTPFDRIEWFLQAGETDNDTQDSSRSPVVQAGIRLPVTSTIALTGGATVIRQHRFAENALDWSHGFNTGPIDGVLSTRFSYLYGSQGERGNIQQVSYNDGFSLSFYRNALTAENCDNRNSGFYGVSGCYRSLSLMLSVPVGGWYASLGYSDNHNEGRYIARRDLPDSDDRHNSGTPWEQVYMTRSHSQSWQGGLSKAFSTNGLNINSSINLFMRNDNETSGKDKGGYLSVSLSLAHQRQGDASSYTSLGATWQQQQHQAGSLSYNVAHNWYADARGENEYGLSASGINSDSVNTSAYTRLGGQYGNGSLTVSDSWERQTQRHTFSSSGNYSSTLALARSGLWLGRWGDGRPASAIGVDVSAPEEEQDSRIAVSLDSGGSADIAANRRALFAVPGYQQTTLTVNESLDVSRGASSEITQGSGSRAVFMVPGKMLRREVRTMANYTWLGQLTDEQHAPLSGSIPLNVNGWNDLGNGGFSAQSDALLQALYLVRQQQFYQCALQVKSMHDVVRYVGTVTCRELTFSALPENVQHQAQLMLAGRAQPSRPTAMNTRDTSATGKSHE
ncbi:TcfC E-set like domain-containing protein [Yokenella regensburgei]|uniref:Fimbrial outer membrane usher protein TcfC n=1 Tax=Yokenella regensburgei TaxID=158877 RepID=A0AB38FR83_9ENTR|nr:TcfC E-set like domain-containing protein [Yokenella regensburgei]KFD19485.1 alpha-fimbriae usher protein [Yokenella regensburgei ATCC 49455]MDQ4431659.1 TcfC E-set like domain-containing protein [Yokenella regensburgei]SQA60239.1 fimbrial outer membrane usher protein TcfC [Yokenella regensburgei]SQA67715.1 fimbrial outer membrane usher protein TcfC [Yokenella regensburgei]SUQ06028.1 fimbrial outer membrane usher protein TcfC [Yokenella regensburgei]